MQRGVVRAGMQIGSPIYLNVSLKQNDSMLQIMMGAVTRRDLRFLSQSISFKKRNRNQCLKRKYAVFVFCVLKFSIKYGLNLSGLSEKCNSLKKCADKRNHDL